MATYRKRNDRWQVQVRLLGHEPISHSFLSKIDGEAWARQVEARLEQSAGPIDLRSLDRIKFGDLLTRYQAEVTTAKRGATVESIRLGRMLLQPMALLPLSRLTGSTFAAYRDQRLRLVSGETVRRELTILRHVLQVAVREWNVPLLINPVSLVARPKPGQARDRRPTATEIADLLTAAGRSRTKHLQSAIILAMETGMRRGELLSMSWRHVNMVRSVVSIPVTKTGDPRTIPLSPVAVELLRGMGDSSSLGRVLEVTPVALRQAWDRLCARVGVTDLHWHDWRHEALSRFFEVGLSLAEVATISGHKDPRMLMRYTHLKPEDIARKLARLSCRHKGVAYA